MTLHEFLLARIAEDEAEIGTPYADEGAGSNGIGWAEVGAINEVLLISQARALAECQAKRQTIEDYLEYDNLGSNADNYEWALERVMSRWAAIYSDHPDFPDRPEWEWPSWSVS